MQSSPVISTSPSFNNYSSGKLAEIAARVVEEFRLESESEFDDPFGLENEEKPNGIDQEQEQPTIEQEEGEDDDDFEFPLVCNEPVQAISADEIFYNGQIRPVFPVFGRDLLFRDIENCGGKVNSCKPQNTSSIRVSLGKLMREDRDPQSCSSSESDDLDGVPAETYCVWAPKSEAEVETPGRCKKSSSTGSSKRWRFRNLLHRSNSDGRESFVFINSSHAKKDDKVSAKEATTEKSSVDEKVKLKVGGGGEVVPVTVAQETHYARNRVAPAGVDGDRRESVHPYRQDLVGFFANVNGLSRNIRPF